MHIIIVNMCYIYIADLTIELKVNVYHNFVYFTLYFQELS